MSRSPRSTGPARPRSRTPEVGQRDPLGKVVALRVAREPPGCARRRRRRRWRRPRRPSASRSAATNLGRTPILQPGHVVEHEDLAVAPRDRRRSRWSARRRRRWPPGRPGPAHPRARWLKHPAAARASASSTSVRAASDVLGLHLEPAHGVDRLGREPEVAHHRDLGVDQGPDHRDPLASRPRASPPGPRRGSSVAALRTASVPPRW